jgi:hypothetical protein
MAGQLRQNTQFKADERTLDDWPMSVDQKLAVLARDLNRCIKLGETSTSSPRSANA